MDGAVYDRLRQKEQTMLEAIDRHVLETMPTSREDLDAIFGQMGMRNRGETGDRWDAMS